MNINVNPGSVVVGTDGSPGGDAAVAWAADYADSRHRALLLLNAAGDPQWLPNLLDSHAARQELRIRARRITDHSLGLVRRLAPGLDVEVTTPLSDPRDALIDLSARASLVAVGTRGRGRVRSLLLGSVSAAAATHASCPVAVVRSPSTRDEQRRGAVVVGVAGNATSRGALDFAFDLASTEGLTLEVVHGWAPDAELLGTTPYDEALVQQDEHQRALHVALAGYADKYPDVTVHRHLPRSSPLATLISLSEAARIVVVGARHHPGPSGMFNSVGRAVAERAHCTVVVVRS
jgi:nucleotide-binding universal stress UspA family protein